MIGRVKLLTIVAAVFFPVAGFGQNNPYVETGMVDYTAVQPAGYEAIHPSGYPGMGDCPDCYGGAGHGYIEERILDPEDEFEAGPLEVFFNNVTKNSWIRTEYLHWKISAVHTNKMLGEPLNGIEDPRDGFSVEVTGEFGFDRNLQVVVPYEDNLSLRDISGVRLTYGIPLTFGAVELTGFALNQASDDYTFYNGDEGVFGIFEPLNLVATSYTTDGALNTPPDGLLFYDTIFKYSIATDIWGAEANMVLERSSPGEGFKIDPLFGFRFLSISDDFKQYGEYNDNAFLGIDPYSVGIRSKTDNHIYGGTAGVRFRLVHRWFVLGVEPKVTLGANHYENSVTSTDFNNNFNNSKNDGTVFNATGELNIFAQIPIHENFSINVGYTGVITERVSRADENIRYQEINNDLAARLENNFKTMWFYGLNVGGELRF